MVKFIKYFPVLVFFLVLGLAGNIISAANYDVQATVPLQAPSIAPVFDSSLRNFLTNEKLIQVFGTCQYLSPVSIVSIWRTTTFLGSTACEQNGTFRISLSLIVGANILQARSNNLSNNYGPEAAPISITYTQPVSATPEYQPPLKVESTKTFQVSDANKNVEIEVRVDGGKAPYTLVINWGDGSQETRTFDKPGNYKFTHTYTKSEVYKVTATVTDVLGQSTVNSFVVVAASDPVAELASIKAKRDTAALAEMNRDGPKWYKPVLIAATSTAGVSVLFLTSFWYGRRYQFKTNFGKDKDFKKLRDKKIGKNNI